MTRLPSFDDRVLRPVGVVLELVVPPAGAADVVLPLRRVDRGAVGAVELVGPRERPAGEGVGGGVGRTRGPSLSIGARARVRRRAGRRVARPGRRVGVGRTRVDRALGRSVAGCAGRRAVARAVPRPCTFGSAGAPGHGEETDPHETLERAREHTSGHAAYVTRRCAICSRIEQRHPRHGFLASGDGCFDWYTPSPPPPGSVKRVIVPHRSSCGGEHSTPRAFMSATNAFTSSVMK